MVILAITLTAWLVLRKYARKPQKRRTTAVYSVPTVSPSELQRRERAAKQAERERIAAEKKQREKEQAEVDKVFYVEQIDKLYMMLWDADAELKAAREACQHDNEMNKHGAVIPDKIAAKHRAERDKLARRVMQLENAIHAKETKLNKAQYVAAN